MLAVGTDRGVVLWDLARGTELAFLPIGNAWHLMFEASGDLITSGATSACSGGRSGSTWTAVNSASARRVGCPCRRDTAGLTEDRSGRIVAMADNRYAYVATPERTIRVGPLDDCRGVAVSPDGQWLATINHLLPGAQVSAHLQPHQGERATHRGRLQPRREVAGSEVVC